MEPSTLWIVITVVVTVAVDVAALIVIPRRRKPTAAMAWLLLILALPLFGVLLFLLIGNVRLPRRRREEQSRISDIIRDRVHGLGRAGTPAGWPRWLELVAKQNEGLTALPPLDGNALSLMADYGDSLARMTEAIHAAERSVHVEFFIVAWDATTAPFFSAMEQAVARGVTVRLLADHLSSRRIANSSTTFAELDRIGVEWSWMLPIRPLRGKYQRPDLRNHRKLVVVDGVVGFTGSQNLIDRSYDAPKNIKRGLQWQELMVRIEGPAVAALDAVFLSDWLVETGQRLDEGAVSGPELARQEKPDGVVCQIVPSGPSYDSENNLRLFLSLIHGATERVILTSPYFVPDEAMIYAITTACRRGLDVQLFVSEIGDQGLVHHAQRSYYDALLEAGVRIFLYPAPYILHAKHFSIDDDIAVIGSSNMDIRSFSLNMEVSMMVKGRSFVERMRQVEQSYRDAGRELTLAEWRREPSRATFLDGLARLTSALN